MSAVCRLLSLLEDHFARTGEWFALCQVMRLKRIVGCGWFRRGWL